MTPLQIVAISALLLACKYSTTTGAVLSGFTSNQPYWCNQSTLINHTDVIGNTHREADIAIRIAHFLLYGKYLEAEYRIEGLKENGQCEPIVLPPTPTAAAHNATLQYTADAFWNLKHLLQLYHYAWSLLELHESDIEESDAAKLDLLEVVFFRLSNQVERYLQVYGCSCENSNCTLHQGINKEGIEEILQREFNPTGCSRKRFLGKIVAALKKVAKTLHNNIELHHGPPEAYIPWSFCATVEAIPIRCK